MPVRELVGAALSAVLLAGCGAAGAAAPTGPAAAPAVAPQHGYHGDEPDGPPSRPSFVLTDTSGRTYDFARETGGSPTLLFFGYTHCPDECPTAMADIRAALQQSSPEVRERTTVVFVTTDPARDDAATLRRWLDQYSPSYVGLRGTPEQVRAATSAVRAAQPREAGPVPTLPGRPDAHEHAPGTAPHSHDSPLGYGVDHSTAIFAFDAADRLPVIYRGAVSPSDIAADLPVLAREESS